MAKASLIIAVGCLLYFCGFRPHSYGLRLLGHAASFSPQTRPAHGKLVGSIRNVTTDVQTVGRILHDFFSQPDLANLHLEQRLAEFLDTKAQKGLGRVEWVLDWVLTGYTIAVPLWLLSVASRKLSGDKGDDVDKDCGSAAHAAAQHAKRRRAQQQQQQRQGCDRIPNVVGAAFVPDTGQRALAKGGGGGKGEGSVGGVGRKCLPRHHPAGDSSTCGQLRRPGGEGGGSLAAVWGGEELQELRRVRSGHSVRGGGGGGGGGGGAIMQRRTDPYVGKWLEQHCALELPLTGSMAA